MDGRDGGRGGEGGGEEWHELATEQGRSEKRGEWEIQPYLQKYPQACKKKKTCCLPLWRLSEAYLLIKKYEDATPPLSSSSLIPYIIDMIFNNRSPHFVL